MDAVDEEDLQDVVEAVELPADEDFHEVVRGVLQGVAEVVAEVSVEGEAAEDLTVDVGAVVEDLVDAAADVVEEAFEDHNGVPITSLHEILSFLDHCSRLFQKYTLLHYIYPGIFNQMTLAGCVATLMVSAISPLSQ